MAQIARLANGDVASLATAAEVTAAQAAADAAQTAANTANTAANTANTAANTANIAASTANYAATSAAAQATTANNGVTTLTGYLQAIRYADLAVAGAVVTGTIKDGTGTARLAKHRVILRLLAGDGDEAAQSDNDISLGGGGEQLAGTAGAAGGTRVVDTSTDGQFVATITGSSGTLFLEVAVAGRFNGATFEVCPGMVTSQAVEVST